MAGTQSSLTLSRRQASRLVSEINQQSADVRAKVLALYQGKGWEALGYESWKECCEGEFVFSRQYAYALLKAAEIEARVTTVVDTKHSLPERHVRELAVVSADRQAEVYTEAVKTAPRGKVTADHIRQTIVTMKLAPNRWGARATASNYTDYLEALDRLTGPQLEVVLRKCLSSIPSRVLFSAVDAARYMTHEEISEHNRQKWAA